MPQEISEADWKRLSEIKPVALERFCQRVLEEVRRVADDAAKTSHERYLAVFALIHERDDELAGAFNALRRSTAIMQLARMRALGLVSDPEMRGFSTEMREKLRILQAAVA